MFERSLELSLRDQCAHWSWQSPNNSGRFVRAFVRFSGFSEDPGDCHVARLPRNDSIYLASQTPIYCSPGRCSGTVYSKMCPKNRTDWGVWQWLEENMCGRSPGGRWREDENGEPRSGPGWCWKSRASGGAAAGVCPPGIHRPADGRPLRPGRLPAGAGRVN